MRVYLVRHGQSEENAADLKRLIGLEDFRQLLEHAQHSPLTALGREQAATVAETIAAFNPTHLYSSPYIRAFDTAQIIATRVGLPIQTINELHEISAIVPFLLRREQHRQLRVMYLRGYLSQLIPHRPLWGETWWVAQRRVIKAWNTMLDQWSPSTRAVVVAHRAFIWMTLRYLQRHGGWRIVRRSTDNAGISELESI